MRKLGFTIAELVITLGIIGVVTAVTAPALSNMRPDQAKANVLKAHDMLIKATFDILENPAFYIEDQNCRGLGCNGANNVDSIAAREELRSAVGALTGTSKYLTLLRDQLNPLSVNGSEMEIFSGTTVNINQSNNPLNFSANVSIRTGNGRNCVYSAGCRKPAIFNFTMDSYGRLTPVDPLSRAYIRNRTKLNDKAKDLAEASSGL